VAKVDPYDIIGSEEVMFETDKRYVSALCQSKTATLLTIQRSDLKSLMLSNTQKKSKNPNQNNQNGGGDTLEDRLQNLAWNKIASLTQKIKNQRNVTENLGNKNKKKHMLVNDKSFEEVKHKIDREYEKVFLKQMTKMKIIRQPKAIKDINKKEYPVTNFYNQLIMDQSRNDSFK